MNPARLLPDAIANRPRYAIPGALSDDYTKQNQKNQNKTKACLYSSLKHSEGRPFLICSFVRFFPTAVSAAAVAAAAQQVGVGRGAADGSAARTSSLCF